MPRFFTDEIRSVPVGGQYTVRGGDAVHIARSLRMRAGDEITLCDGAGSDYLCRILDAGDEVTVEVCGREPSRGEPNVELKLFQCLPKGDKMELIVQKAVELGAAQITPVLSSRCISRPDEKSARKKGERLQKIADEAAGQCGRGRLPQVTAQMKFAEALTAAQEDLLLFCYEGGGVPISQALMQKKAGQAVSLLIGSEGGFSPEEAEQAKAAGAVAVTLGPRILRCETAPLCAISAVMYATGNLD